MKCTIFKQILAFKESKMEVGHPALDIGVLETSKRIFYLFSLFVVQYCNFQEPRM